MIELAKWQRKFIEFFKSKDGNAVLWCETGLGKTIVASYISSKLLKAFIVVPPHLIGDWIGKLKLWGITEDKINILKNKNETFDENKINIISINKYALKSTNIKNLNKKMQDSILIIDECHNIKNYKSNIFKKLNEIRDYYDHTLLISATLLGKNTFDFYAYMMLVNREARKEFNSNFWNFTKENHIEWDIVRVSDGKNITVPKGITPYALKKYFYPFVFKQTYEQAGVRKPEYIYKDVIFDFTPKHEKMLKDVKSKMKFDICGKKINIDDIDIDSLSYEDLEQLSQAIHNTHPYFYQLMNCVYYETNQMYYINSIEELNGIKELYPDKFLDITYSNKAQKDMLEESIYSRDDLVVIRNKPQLNDMIWVLVLGDVKYYDIDKKMLEMDSIISSHENQKGFLTYYFQGEGEILKSHPDVYVYKKESDLENFEKSDKKILVSQIGQIGEGIRLKKCDYIIEFSLYYNFIDIIQSRGRLGYANADKTITIYSLIPSTKDTMKIRKNVIEKLKLHNTEFYK